MKPTQHTSNNDVLRAPPGASVEECRPLAITRVQYADGTTGVWSFWQPTDDERKAIADGALVKFCAIGGTHPPVYIGVDGLEDA